MDLTPPVQMTFYFRDYDFSADPPWEVESMELSHKVDSTLRALVVLTNKAKQKDSEPSFAGKILGARSLVELGAVLAFGYPNTGEWSPAYPLLVRRAVEYKHNRIRVFCVGAEEAGSSYRYVGKRSGAAYSSISQFLTFVCDTFGVKHRKIEKTVNVGGDIMKQILGEEFDSVSYTQSPSIVTSYGEGTSPSKRFGFYFFTTYTKSGELVCNSMVPTVDTATVASYIYDPNSPSNVHFRPILTQGTLASQYEAYRNWYSPDIRKYPPTKFWAHSIEQDMPGAYDISDDQWTFWWPYVNSLGRGLLTCMRGQFRMPGTAEVELGDVVNIANVGATGKAQPTSANWWVSGISHRLLRGKWSTELEVARPGS